MLERDIYVLVSIFCDVDDFCKKFEPEWRKILLEDQKNQIGKAKIRNRKSELSLSEAITIVIMFHKNGFKLHLIINDIGEILTYMLTPGNVDDRVPVPSLSKDLLGKLFGDKGYISQELFLKLYERGLEIITRLKRNIKNKLMSLFDKILLRKRGIIECVNNKLKSNCQIEHHRHRSCWNFLVNLVSGIVAYAYDPYKPCVQFTKKQRSMLLNLIAA